jgi:hypothetical protein
MSLSRRKSGISSARIGNFRMPSMNSSQARPTSIAACRSNNVFQVAWSCAV